MVKKKHKALARMLVIPLVLSLTGCMSYSLNALSDRNRLIGTWEATELPGKPTMTLTDAPIYAEGSENRLYDGEVDLIGWPVEIIGHYPTDLTSESIWTIQKTWRGLWDFEGNVLFLSLTEVDATKDSSTLEGIGTKLELVDAQFALNCVDAYFGPADLVAPTRMCRV